MVSIVVTESSHILDADLLKNSLKNRGIEAKIIPVDENPGTSRIIFAT